MKLQTAPSQHYGCHNRKPFVDSIEQQDGWVERGDTRNAVLVETPHRMAKDCQYTHTKLGQDDKRCAGCLWRVVV